MSGPSTDYEIGEFACCPCFETLASLAPQHEVVMFQQLDLILRRPPTGRANARPMTGSVAVSKLVFRPGNSLTKSREFLENRGSAVAVQTKGL